ncbi:hypothetical protein BDE02_01G114600 [Populus trichocarpa]|nr:hypothetical protein BDE02_01G114600 [Populus trichocarpa]
MPQEEICGSEFDSDHVRHRFKQKQLVGEESTMIYIACKEILARISLTTLIPCKGEPPAALRFLHPNLSVNRLK